MKLILEYLFKNLYLIFFNKNYRKFGQLALILGGRKRYEEAKIKVQGESMTIVDSLSFLWQFYEIYCLQSYHFSTSKVNPLIIDCGSNIGLSIKYYLGLYPQANIKAYEASKSIYKVLSGNLKNIKTEHLELNNKAIWKEDAILKFNDEGADGGSINENGYDVQAVSLLTILQNEKEIDFLKMDIEGAEVEVINSCKSELNKVNNIFIEYHSFPGYSQNLQDILTVLKETGFRYSLQVPNPKEFPIGHIKSRQSESMDLQVNIWGTRI